MNKDLLILKNIHKSFSPQIHVLKGVDLTLIEGSTTAIMGASGEGKSTLLHIASGLDTPTSGRVLLDQIPLDQQNLASVRSHQIGFIFQAFHLLEDLSVLQNILMPAHIARKSIHKGSKSFKRACELLKKVGLEDRADHLVKLLSGGEKQRVCIARALCNDPNLIFADEPTGNLDNTTSNQIHSLLIEMAKQFGKTLLVATHNKEFSSLCDRILLLQDGQLKA